jgi:hypothetical protein
MLRGLREGLLDPWAASRGSGTARRPSRQRRPGVLSRHSMQQNQDGSAIGGDGNARRSELKILTE